MSKVYYYTIKTSNGTQVVRANSVREALSKVTSPVVYLKRTEA